jgi:hypothetical protein
MINREERETLRKRYLPNHMNILFVGESPPQGGTFFYNEDSILFEATRNGFLAAFPDRDFVSAFLKKFKDLGCYLDDLSATPINKMSPPEKRALRKAGEEALAGKIRLWNPSAIVVVMMGVSDNVRSALAQAGMEEIRFFELPFPRRDFGRYEQFVDGLSEVLIRLNRDRVLDISRIPRD